MTVAELIEELSKVENKSVFVTVVGDSLSYEDDVREVIPDSINVLDDRVEINFEDCDPY